jgi:hypothetical protein
MFEETPMKKRILILSAVFLLCAGMSYANSNLFYPYVNIPTGSSPDLVAIGDINGDGRNDLVLATNYDSDSDNDYQINVYLQNASGELSFSGKYPTNASPDYPTHSIGIGDMNHDGRADVIVGNGKSIEVFLQNDSGGLDPSISYPGLYWDMKIVDLNNDGLLDIMAATWGTQWVVVFFQNQDGILNPPEVVYELLTNIFRFLVVTDVNNDGLKDLVGMGYSAARQLEFQVILQEPGGGFARAAKYAFSSNSLDSCNGFAVGDISGDNLPDIVFTCDRFSSAPMIGVLYQEESGILRPAVIYEVNRNSGAIAVGDVNNDGRNDLIIVHSGEVGVLLQSQTGLIFPEELYGLLGASHYYPDRSAIGDINGDGLIDIVGINYGLTVLYNAWGHTEVVSAPATPGGWTNCTSGILYTYTSGGSTSEFDHTVQYLFDWGDGTDSGWLPIGTINASKFWRFPGTYSARVKARCATDTYAESDWSNILLVTVNPGFTEFWAMNVGNIWNYQGSDSGGHTWASYEEIYGPDLTTVSGITTVEKKGFFYGNYIGSTWFSLSPDELREWKEVVIDPDNGPLTLTLRNGLTWARSPILVGDNWTTTTDGMLSGMGTSLLITASMEVHVISRELVTVPSGTYDAFKFQQTIHLTSYTGSTTGTAYYWFVPYLGVVKRQGSDSRGTVNEDLASTNVTGPFMFLDVPGTHFARSFIESLAAAGITGGCAQGPPRQYCPEESVTRGQMAVFLVASLGGAPAACTGRFTDVPIDNPFCGFIEKLAADGITGGCSESNFCPDDPVTRGQMAVFIETALGNPTNTCTARFSDVPLSDSFCGFIERLASDGITGGCGGSNFCPNVAVTRAQMAVFLVAAPSPLNP